MFFEKSIKLLNQALENELKSYRQYLKFHFLCSIKGMKNIAAMFMEIALDEMKHAEMLTERILFLKGEVLLNKNCRVIECNSADAILDKAMTLKQKTIADYVLAAHECGTYSDPVSRRLFEELEAEEENHLNRFDLELISLRKHDKGNMMAESTS